MTDSAQRMNENQYADKEYIIFELGLELERRHQESEHTHWHWEAEAEKERFERQSAKTKR